MGWCCGWTRVLCGPGFCDCTGVNKSDTSLRMQIRVVVLGDYSQDLRGRAFLDCLGPAGLQKGSPSLPFPTHSLEISLRSDEPSEVPFLQGPAVI